MNRINIAAGFLLTLVLSIQCTAQMGNVDTKHVADSAFFVLRIDVERLSGHLKESRKDFDKISEMIKKESGIDVASLKCLTLQFADQPDGKAEPSFAMTLEFKKDFDRKTLMSDFAKRRTFEKAEINGKTYMRADANNGPHFYFESNRKFTAATNGGINAILKSGGGMGKVASQLKSAPPNSELVAVFQRTEKLGESLRFFIGALNDLGGPIKMDELLEQGQSGLGVINLTDSVPISIQLDLDTTQNAEKLKTNLDLLVTMGKTLADPTRKQLKAQIKELKDAKGLQAMQRNAMEVAVKGLGVGERILNGMKITAKNKTVDIKVRQMGGMVELADLMVYGTQFFVMGTSSDIEVGPGPPIRGIEEKAVDRPVKR